jgi:RNA polymerase sigma factor (sigma-70 family)
MEPPDASSRLDLLYRQHGQIVVAICGALLRERNDAEDAAQQVFLSAYRAILNGTVPRDPGAWLAVIARNECRARWQVPRHEPAAEDLADEGGADPPADVIRRAEIAALWQAISELPPLQREALLLREIRGLSYGQLSDNLALSRSSVRSLLSRARTRVRSRLHDGFAAAGGASWLEPVLRLFGGGSGAAVSAATKVAAVGLGAAALAGGAAVGPEQSAQVTDRPPRFTGPAAAAVHPHAVTADAPTRSAVRFSRPLPARTSYTRRRSRSPEHDRVGPAVPAVSEPEHAQTIQVADSSGNGTDGGKGTVTTSTDSSGTSGTGGTGDGSLTSTAGEGSGDLLVVTTTSSDGTGSGGSGSGGSGSGGSGDDSSSTSGSDLTSGSSSSDGH